MTFSMPNTTAMQEVHTRPRNTEENVMHAGTSKLTPQQIAMALGTHTPTISS